MTFDPVVTSLHSSSIATIQLCVHLLEGRSALHFKGPVFFRLEERTTAKHITTRWYCGKALIETQAPQPTEACLLRPVWVLRNRDYGDADMILC